LANLHQIRLYFHYILEEQYAAANVPVPSKVDFRCVNLSFQEMRQDGFADDGLFDRMKKFFLPLTTTEQDLNVSDARWATISKKRIAEKNGLEIERFNIIRERERVEDRYYNLDEFITDTTREINKSENNNRERLAFERQISEYRRERDKLEPQRNDLRSRLDKIDDMLANIEQALNREKQNTGARDLIKPNRGFIMYGPPGK
jgi:hypothetical protein